MVAERLCAATPAGELRPSTNAAVCWQVSAPCYEGAGGSSSSRLIHTSSGGKTLRRQRQRRRAAALTYTHTQTDEARAGPKHAVERVQLQQRRRAHLGMVPSAATQSRGGRQRNGYRLPGAPLPP